MERSSSSMRARISAEEGEVERRRARPPAASSLSSASRSSKWSFSLPFSVRVTSTSSRIGGGGGPFWRGGPRAPTEALPPAREALLRQADPAVRFFRSCFRYREAPPLRRGVAPPPGQGRHVFPAGAELGFQLVQQFFFFRRQRALSEARAAGRGASRSESSKESSAAAAGSTSRGFTLTQTPYCSSFFSFAGLP